MSEKTTLQQSLEWLDMAISDAYGDGRDDDKLFFEGVRAQLFAGQRVTMAVLQREKSREQLWSADGVFAAQAELEAAVSVAVKTGLVSP